MLCVPLMNCNTLTAILDLLFMLLACRICLCADNHLWACVLLLEYLTNSINLAQVQSTAASDLKVLSDQVS